MTEVKMDEMMKNNKKKSIKKTIIKAVSAVTLIGLALSATACSNKSGATEDKGTVKVGILQLIDQTALTEARKGFEAELKAQGYTGDKIKIDYVNAQGDQSNLRTMSEKLKKDKNDVNLALATPAAQALQKVDPDTPMLFTAVTDAKSAGLVGNLKAPDTNATGVTDNVDMNIQIDFLHKLLPKAKTVGIIYNASEQNSLIQVKQAEKELKAKGIKVEKLTVASTNDVEQATRSMAKKVDAIYLPTDNTMAAAMATVGKISKETKVSVIPGASTMVLDGGVANRGLDYNKLGHQTAKMAIKILKGKKVKDLAVEQPKDIDVIMNKTMMKALGITEQQVNDAK